MMVPFFSIVTPAYNAAGTIESCIESVQGQGFSSYEHVVIDDGSTDATLDLCTALAASDERLVVHHVENGGVASARNYGLHHATGRYILFLDSDDELPKDALCAYSEACERHGMPDVVMGTAEVMDESGETTGLVDFGSTGIYTVDELLEGLNPRTKAPLLHYIWNKVYGGDFLREFALEFSVDFALGEDFLFNCEVFGCARQVVLVPNCVYRYRKNLSGLSLTQAFRPNELERRRAMEGALLDLYSRKNLLESNRTALEAMFGKMCMVSLESVGLESCKLGLHDKRAFVEDFYKSEYMGYVQCYSELNKNMPATQSVPIHFFVHGNSTALVFFYTARRFLKSHR